MDLQLFADESVNTGEVADPQTEVDNTVDENEGSSVADNSAAGVAGQPKQTPEQNAAFAQMRRELETYKRQLAERDRWVAENFGKSHGITTWAQYQAAVMQQLQQQQEQLRAQKEQEFAEAGYDPKTIREIMKHDPEFQQLKQQNQLLIQQIQQDQLNQRLMREFNELKAEYPDLVKAPEDIPPEVWQKFDRGYSLVDAFTVVKKADLMKRTEQQTISSIGSKSHLATEKGGSAGDIPNIEISQEQMAVWRKFFPNETEAQLKKRIAKHLKK